MADIINFKEMKEKKEQEHFDNIVSEDIENEELFAFIGMQAALDVVQFLEEQGYEIEAYPEVMRDIFLVIEAIRALGHRVAGEDHSMQLVSDTIFNVFEDEEELLSEFLQKLDEE